MSSTKLRKYLAYYRKTLRDDPENIEARLRLAALFREMERPRHAIEEYVTAAKLLASEGLPLEAIAACKAVLELDPTHKETQFFLAKLYARVPEATGDSVRVARPLQTEPALTLEKEKPTQRLVSLAEDQQSFDLAVFDLEGLEIDAEGSDRWDNISIPEEIEYLDSEPTEVEEDDLRRTTPVARVARERQFRISSLPEIALFSQLPRQVFLDFLEAMEIRRLPAGAEILRADDPVSSLYVVVHGRVRVEKELLDGRTVELAVMGEGQVFGEFRLLTGKGGTSRVVAETQVEVLEVRDEVVYRIGGDYPAMWDVLWGYYFERMLNHSMASSEIFRDLSGEERALVAQHFRRRDLAVGEALFRRGQEVDALSLVVNGGVSIEVPRPQGTEVLEVLEEGSFVGVSPCAQQLPATANALAIRDLVVMEMPGGIFREVMYGLPDVAEAVRRVIRRRRARTTGLFDETPRELV